MTIIESLVTRNPCYQNNVAQIDSRYTTFQRRGPVGLMLHSVGCPQPSGKAFAQRWNDPNYTDACVHAFIDANDGTIYQCLPWHYRGWHGGGASNNTHVGVEMCEPDCIRYTSGFTFTCSDWARAKAMVERTYNAAVELFAMLCEKYDLDPMTDIISHAEGYKLGIASNHGDPEHLWRGMGLPYTMNTFRAAVRDAMKKEEEPEVTVADFIAQLTPEQAAEIVNKAQAAYAGKSVPKWAKAEMAEAMELGITDGTSPMQLTTRVQTALMAKRAAEAAVAKLKEGEDE